MQLKTQLKQLHSLTYSSDYFEISLYPKNTCPLISALRRSIKDQLKGHEEKPAAEIINKFLVDLEDYRASCDSIRKEVLIVKDNLWGKLERIVFATTPEAKKLAEQSFAKWKSYAYTDADTNKLDKFLALVESDLALQSEFPSLLPTLVEHLGEIKQNIFRLNDWRTEYFNLVNNKKELILEKIKRDTLKL